jgi:hypothetical protein
LPDVTDDVRPGDFGTALVIHAGDDAFYLDASTWTVHDLNGSDPDDDGNIHYVVDHFDDITIDHQARTVSRRLM